MWTCKFFKMKKKFYKKLKKWKRYLLKYLEKKSVGNCKTFLSFTQVPQKVQRKRWKMKWKMHAMESQQRWNLFWNYLIHLAQPISTRCSQFTLWKTLFRGYKRWTPGTNGLKETILGGCNKRREMDFFKLIFIFWLSVSFNSVYHCVLRIFHEN